MNIEVDGMDFHVNLSKLKQIKEYIATNKIDGNEIASHYVLDIINIIIDKNTNEMQKAMRKIGRDYDYN